MALRIETLVYTETPPIPRGIVERLTQIGGTNEFGEPLLRWEWGGTETWFRAGQQRFKYPSRKPLKRELRGYILWDTQKSEPCGYLKPGDATPPMAAHVILKPDMAWLAHGDNRWHLAEWYPPELLALDYDRSRYMSDPDTGQIVDMLGPFPARGQYRDTGIRLGACPDSAQLEFVEQAVRMRCEQAKGSWREVRPIEKARQQMIEYGRTPRKDAEEAAARAEMIRDSKEAGLYWIKWAKGKAAGWSLPAPSPNTSGIDRLVPGQFPKITNL